MVRFDILLQARQGFYAASAFIVVVVGGLLLMIPAAARADAALWAPALFVVNLPITTLFFMTGLMLLERDEGTLAALGVSPYSAAEYFIVRIVTLTALAIAETLVVAWIAFEVGTWPWLVAGAAALGVFYTGCGAGISGRYTSVNEMILPASVFVTFLLLPLLPHFGLMPRGLMMAHPVEPPLTLLRAAYDGAAPADAAFGIFGSLAWCVLSWRWGTRSVARAMRDTRATGGR
jgi:fluoroquinolone transport system permease protein